MSFSFKIKGSIYLLALETVEIKLKAREESFGPDDLEIEEHFLDPAPYIIVTCKDTRKGEKLYKRVQREIPRFERV